MKFCNLKPKKNILEEILEVQKLDMSTPPAGISSCLFFAPAAVTFQMKCVLVLMLVLMFYTDVQIVQVELG